MTTCLKFCNGEEELLLASFLAIDFAKFLKIESCLAYTCLGGLVVSLYDINFDSIAKSIDLFNKFLHDIFELKFLLQRYIINQFLSSIYFQNILSDDASEREQGVFSQLEMLCPERDSDDCNAKNNTEHKVSQCNLPPAEDYPKYIECGCQAS